MQTIYPREKGKYLILIHCSWRTWVDSAYFSATAASTRSSVSSSGWAPWQWTWPTSSRTYSRSAMMAMRVNMVEIEKLLVIVILKEESKQHGRSLVIITGYSQVNNLFLPKKYEKIIWNVNTKWEHIVMGSFWFGDTHQRKYGDIFRGFRCWWQSSQQRWIILVLVSRHYQTLADTRALLGR